jgi:hypothetical protein
MCDGVLDALTRSLDQKEVRRQKTRTVEASDAVCMWLTLFLRTRTRESEKRVGVSGRPIDFNRRQGALEVL